MKYMLIGSEENIMNIIEKSVDELKPYENNPRHNDKAVKYVAESIKKFGFKVPVVIDANDVIVCGHTRWKAAKRLKMKTLPCIIADDLSDEQIRAFRLADNKVSEIADWDMSLLNFEMGELKDYFDFSDFGFDFSDKDKSDNDSISVKDDKYEVKLPEIPISKYGDIYKLGIHRLMCGDSTKINDVEKLMGTEKANILFTSPPYNAGKTPTEEKANKNSKYINNDDNKNEEEYKKFLVDFTLNSLKICDYSFVNIQSLSNNKLSLIDYLYEMKEYYADTIIWDKINSQPAMANNVLNSVFEYVHVFSHKHNRAIGSKQFRGTLDNIVHIKKQQKNEYYKIHNATFPIEFAEYFIKNFSNESVVDLFGGVGTTLIVCEQLKRKCFMMELEPKYVDAIIDRWEKFTGQEAVKIS